MANLIKRNRPNAIIKKASKLTIEHQAFILAAIKEILSKQTTTKTDDKGNVIR